MEGWMDGNARKLHCAGGTELSRPPETVGNLLPVNHPHTQKLVSRLVRPGLFQCLVLSHLCGSGEEGAVCSHHLVCLSSWAYIFP